MTPATYTVNALGDAGVGVAGAGGDIRWCLDQANANAGADVIDFNIAGAGAKPITLGSSLSLTDVVTIDATTQPGWVGTPRIILEGGPLIGPLDSAFELNSVTGCWIKGFNIHGFNIGAGITITGGANNHVEACFIGVNETGTAAAAALNDVGIRINNSTGNVIGGANPGTGNLISGNLFQGIDVTGAGSGYNYIQNNLIGTNLLGTGAIGNGTAGITLSDASGVTTVSYNVISGNQTNGVLIDNSFENIVANNYIGTNKTGMGAVANLNNGVKIAGESLDNRIGIGSGGNIISGNHDAGIWLEGYGVIGTIIQGNSIGLASDFATTLANGTAQQPLGGIVSIDAVGSVIGGSTAAGEGNTISGNFGYGISISGGCGDAIYGNSIGVNKAGTLQKANTYSGVYISESSSVIIGDVGVNYRNVISGNGSNGVNAGIQIYNSTSTQIVNNYIGTNKTGTAAIANSGNGILVEGSSSNTMIGGLGVTFGNLISGNTSDGIRLATNTTSTTIQGNLIGTDNTGDSQLANAGNGIYIMNGSTNNTIGNVEAGKNWISGNALYGIRVMSAGNVIDFNVIGLKKSNNAVELRNFIAWRSTVSGNTWGANNKNQAI